MPFWLQTHPNRIIYPFDLAGANENEYQELADKIDEEYGSLQGLLHSAVEFSSFTPISNLVRRTGTYLKRQPECSFSPDSVLLPTLEKSQHASIVFTV